MSDTITIQGFLGADPQQRSTQSGTPMATFRIASTARYQDKETQQWIDGGTSWYSVAAFNRLAQNVLSSLQTGDPVIITGRPRSRQWETSEGARGSECEIVASNIGHDLVFGTSTLKKNPTPDSANNLHIAESPAADVELSSEQSRETVSL